MILLYERNKILIYMQENINEEIHVIYVEFS